MAEPEPSPRKALVRQSLVFQLKLVVDGLRDFVMVPLSLAATVMGLLRSAEDPDLEFRRVLHLGRRSERWINLFGKYGQATGGTQSMDDLVRRAEEVLREQMRGGGVSGSAGEALETALERLHRAASVGETGKNGSDSQNGER